MSEDDSSGKSEIETISKPTVEQIPFSLVEKHANKTTKLLANSSLTQPVEGQRRWYSFQFKEPIFITRVQVNHNNYQKYHEFQFNAETASGKKQEIKSKPEENMTTFTVNSLCTSVSFRPPKAYFAKRSITSVEIYGFQEYEISKFIEYANSIDSVKSEAIKEIDQRQFEYKQTIARAEKAEAEVSAARKDLSNLKSQADRKKSEIKRLESQRDELTVKVEAQETRLASNNTELETIGAKIDSQTVKHNSLNTKVTEHEDTLANLRANIDLFPSELESFVRQGSTNNRSYFWLALAPILVIGATFCLLVSGAVDLTTLITEQTNVNLLALVVSRLPFVFVTLALVTACYKIARSFIIEIMRVNEQRLNLTKISIIAKDVSSAAEAGLDIDDERKYHLRLVLKMDMLKDHLKEYISSEFKPTVPESITSMFSSSEKSGRLSRGKKSDTKTTDLQEEAQDGTPT